MIRLKEIIQPSTSVEHKVSYGDRDIQKSTDICLQEWNASRMKLLGAKKWFVPSKCFFWYQTETYLLENIQSEKGF